MPPIVVSRTGAIREDGCKPSVWTSLLLMAAFSADAAMLGFVGAPESSGTASQQREVAVATLTMTPGLKTVR
jgi:hypothetical protein